MTRMIAEDEHDLSHKVSCLQNGYSVICLIRGIDCKNAVYTPPQGEKVANSARGLDCKYAADLLGGSKLNKQKVLTWPIQSHLPN